MGKIKVLWIDDQPTTAFKDYAYVNDIEIVVKTCFSDGINWLENNNLICDAVILDANCKINNDESEAPSTDSLRDSLFKVNDICKSDKFIPWFVYTGGEYQGEDSLKNMIPNNRDWDDRQYYKKPKDIEELFANLKKAADNSFETQIKLKYDKVFGFYPKIEKDLISVLSCVEKKNFKDNNIFNIIRKIVFLVMKDCIKAGIIPDEKLSPNDQSRFLGQKELSSIIPIYIQRSFHSCSEITNDGSHSNEGNVVVDEHVKEGKAPFLIQSTVYELLNILYWYRSLSLNLEDINKRKAEIIKLLRVSEGENQNDSTKQEVSIHGVIEQDSKNNFYCKEVVLPYKDFVNKDHLGKKIHITKQIPNPSKNTKGIYPFFACEFTIE